MPLLFLLLLIKEADNRNENSAITIWSIHCDLIQTPTLISFWWWKLLQSQIKSVERRDKHGMTEFVKAEINKIKVNLENFKALQKKQLTKIKNTVENIEESQDLINRKFEDQKEKLAQLTTSQ